MDGILDSEISYMAKSVAQLADVRLPQMRDFSAVKMAVWIGAMEV